MTRQTSSPSMSVYDFVFLHTAAILALTYLRGCACGECHMCTRDCHITMTPSSELRFPILASDDRVYDAFALQQWLRVQWRRNPAGPFFVVPGNAIETLRPLPFNLLARALCRGRALHATLLTHATGVGERLLAVRDNLHRRDASTTSSPPSLSPCVDDATRPDTPDSRHKRPRIPEEDIRRPHRLGPLHSHSYSMSKCLPRKLQRRCGVFDRTMLVYA